MTGATAVIKERQRMSTNEKGTHLTLEDRKIVQKGIENGSTKTSIANTLGKDNSTIVLNSLFIADYRNSLHIDPIWSATSSMASWRKWKCRWRRKEEDRE